ncbi:non-histone protein [Coemansia sp. RSA 1933]|nr:non-histone protein [Coemansia sp. RSA 1933]
MKIERNVLLERFERTHHYGVGHHDDDDDSASDSDAPLKDTFPRPQLSDVDMNDQSLYMPTSATTTTSTVSGRGRRKNQTHVSTGSTPRQQSLNGTHGDHSASAAPTTTTSTATPVRKPRAEKDPHAPKRPANAFVMFCQSERPSIKSSGIEMTSGELTRAMSAKWKNLPRSEKQRFYDNYEREMVRYQQELLTYKEGGTAPPTPASDSAAIKSTNAQQKQQQQPPSSSASAVIVEENGTDTTSLPVDPLQQQPSSASSTSSAFAASTIKKSSVMDIGVISDRVALPLESSSPKRNGTGPPSYIAEPETLPAENYHHRSDAMDIH